LARQIHAIQFFRPEKQCSITAPADVRDNFSRYCLGLDVAAFPRSNQPLLHSAG
jgi:hypothetical protein